MKMMWMIIVIVLLSTLQANGQKLNKEEVDRILADSGIETVVVPKGTFEPDPKWSIELGIGSGFRVGTKETGKLKDYSNSPAHTARIGYSLLKYIEIQGEYSGVRGFSKTQDPGPSADVVKRKREFVTYTINLKLKAPFQVKRVSVTPYVVAGVGKVNAEYRIEVSRYTNWQTTMSASDIITKIGGGLQIGAYKNLFIFSEFNYWKMKKASFTDELGPPLEMSPFYSMMVSGLGLRF